ncbi:Imm1 family immunity protein [Mitsuaria sp. 7]|uniref:Imm1 family immunity protein n=1 Tax=Mitsuaria sp. 7 TaxID=1658665 RepID=UPI0007DD077D|nr:Imm1 family immunity protein [Mitsuaria sp. 7]ANH68022.1 hypothetical protein ABE85_11365 [Mitsuaria sp. 7]
MDLNFYVNRMVADRRGGVLCTEEETLMPTADDLGVALCELDARSRTLICLYGQDGIDLTIGGGAGQYVVFASNADEQFWNLVNQAATDDSGVVLLNAGGQEGDFPARQVVTQPQALQAAQTFLQTGALDDSLCWERQE